MNDFLAFESASRDECYLVLRRPQDGGAVDIRKMLVPIETLREVAAHNCEPFADRIAGFLSLVDAGLFDWTS